MTQFGSPKQNDYIAKVEKSINDVVDRTTKHFEAAVDRIAPRAIGSQKLSTDEEFSDYLLLHADAPDPTEAGYQWVSEKAGQYGLPKALELYADYVARNEARLQEYGQPAPADTPIDVRAPARARETEY